MTSLPKQPSQHNFAQNCFDFQTMAGFLFDILNVVHSTLGFNFTFISPTPSGLIDENVWTNLIEMVGRYEVDFSMMDTTIMLSRFKVKFWDQAKRKKYTFS